MFFEDNLHKIYDYIFTGQNKHVLNCRLDFNMAYYQAVTLGTGNPENDKTPNTMSPQVKDVVQSNQGQNVANDETVEDKRAKDLMGTILNDGSDMITSQSGKAIQTIHFVGDELWEMEL